MMANIFEDNLNKFSKICSKTALVLPNIESTQCEFCLTRQGELNLKKKDFYFHSQDGALKEAQSFLNPFLKEDSEALYIYGVGLGYSYFAAKEWLKKKSERRIVFLEDDLDVLKIFLQTERAADLLTNPQARLIALEPDDGIDGAEVLIECCNKSFYIAALPSYWQQRKEDFQKIVKIIRTYQFLFSNRLREELNHELLAPNFYRKLAKISEARSIKGLIEAFANIPSLIIGAGPSLEDDLPLLKELEDRAIFFGAGSAMNALNTHGIYTHFGAGIDPTPVQTSRIKTNAAFETPFFYTNRFSYEAFELIHGPKIFSPQDPEKPWCSWFEHQLGIINPLTINAGFSTSNYSTAVALFLGCNPIVLLGLDMAYDEDKKYLSGIKTYPGDTAEVMASLKKLHPEAIKVTNFEGKAFDTTVAFINESAWFTVKAKEYPKTQFIYGSEKGLGVNRVPRKSLKEISQYALKRQYDLLNQIHSAIETATNPIKKKDVMATFQKWKKSLSRCLLLLFKMQHICKHRIRKTKYAALAVVYSADWILLETELQEEFAFQYLLQNVGLASELLEISTIIQFRFNEDPSPQEKTLFQLQLLKKKYEKMIHVSKVHLQALKIAMKKHPKIKECGKENSPILNNGEIYSFENGFLRIFDTELDLDISESFHPPAIPNNLKETPEWRNHEPIREAYAYRDKIMEGECMQYFPNGIPKAKQYYQKGLLHGPSTFFNADGKLLAQSWFYKGKREGKTIRYFSSGRLNAIERWREGMREGRQEYLYPNGCQKSIIEFHRGLLHGKVELFYPNSVMKFYSSFIEGKKTGKEEFFYLNGTKISQVEYDNNQPVGTAFFWHSNGQIAKKIVFNKNGGFYLSEWDSNGKELVREQFSHSHSLIEEAETLKQSILDLMNGKPETIL